MANTGNLFTFEWDAEVSDAERDRMFDQVVGAARKWRLEVPATLFLQMTVPLSSLAGQSLIVFSPWLAMLLPGGLNDVQKFSQILSRRENMQLLVHRLMQSEEDSHAARKR